MTKKIDVVPNGEITLAQAVQQIEPNGEIILQPGIHLLDQTIKITKPLTIKKASENQEDLTISVVGKSAFLVDLPSIPPTEDYFDLETLNPDDVIDNVLLEGLTIVCQEGDGTAELNVYPSAVNVVSGRLILKNCDITSAERSGCSVRSLHAQIIVDHCNIHDTKDGGIFFDNNGCGLIQNCTISDTGLSCIDAEEGGTFLAINCKISAGDLACVLLHDGGIGSCSDSFLLGNSFVNAVIITDNSKGGFNHCEIHEVDSETIQECQQDKETFSECNFVLREDDDQQEDESEEEYTEEEYEKSGRIKEDLMTTILGPPHDLVQHAIIPYSIGGSLDIYYYATKYGTALATQELANPHFDKPRNRDMNAYELAMISQYPFDLKELEMKEPDPENDADEDNDNDSNNKVNDDENNDDVNNDNEDIDNDDPHEGCDQAQENHNLTPFEKDNIHINTVLNMLARYIETGAKLNHGDTLEFPADFEDEDVAGRCFIFSRYDDPVKVPESDHKFGIMVAIEIFRSEMLFAMHNSGGEKLLEMLNAAGIGLVSNLDRSPLVPAGNENSPKDKSEKTLPTEEEVRNKVLNFLSEHNSKVAEKISGLLEIPFAPEVQNLIFEIIPNPPYLGIMLYVVDEMGDEVFCNDPKISPINSCLEILDDVPYLSETDWGNESFDDFPDRFYDSLFAEWFHPIWEKAGGERLPFRSLLTIHDGDDAFDLKKSQWLKDEDEEEEAE